MDALLALLLASSTLAQCEFAIVHPTPASVGARGPQDIVTRVRPIRQADSPVAISGMDFHDTELIAAPGSYLLNREMVTVELLNLSDRVVSAVKVRIHTGWANGSGTASSQTFRNSIQPGERVSLVVRGGRSQGINPNSEEVIVTPSIESLSIGNCKYQPSKLMPLAQQR